MTFPARKVTPVREARELRVAIFSDAVPERNGVGTYYWDLLEHLRDHVERVALICPECPSTARSYLTLPLPGDHTQKICVPPVYQLTRRLWRLAPHVVIVPTPGPYGLFGLGLARRLGATLIAGFHTHYEGLMTLYKKPVLKKVSDWYFSVCNKALFRYSAVVLANSHQMAATARGIGAAHVELMGTLIAREFLEHPLPPQSSEIRRVIFAGRLAPEKNLEAVISAAQELSDIEFLIAGDGPLRDHILRWDKALPNLTYLGWLTRSEMRSVHDQADMLVLPSHVESFGTIAFEGMARGRLVLVSANCGILDWPALNQAIFQIAPEETLANAIRRVARIERSRRVRKAHLAAEVVRKTNIWSLQQWLRVLIDHGMPKARTADG
jgi:glycosyltransferase involved in cell wall biosynthesis